MNGSTKFRSFYIIAFAILLIAIPKISKSQSTVDIPAMKDNTLYQASLGSLSNGAGSYFFVGDFNPLLKRGLIAFNIADSIPAGAAITNVTLQLHMSSKQRGSELRYLHRLSSDWGEGTSDAAGAENDGAPSTPSDATWDHTFYDTSFWTSPGGDFAASPSASQVFSNNGFFTWSTAQMVADVQDWLDNPANNFGWLLKDHDFEPGSIRRFDSRENSIEANRPKLTVTYVEPAPTVYPFILDDDFANACAGTGTGASGFGLAILDEDSSNLSFFIIHDVSSPTFAQVHNAAICETGISIFEFSSPSSPISQGLALDSSDVYTLVAGSLYVTIHSAAFPGGEIRGQIIPEPIRFIVTLDEAQANAGTGTGSFAAGCAVLTLSSDGTQFSINVTHDVESGIFGNIHIGAPGVSGPQMFSFPDTAIPIIENWVLDTNDIKDLLSGNLYVEIHSDRFPSGEIRGQIERQEISFLAQLDGSQANAGAGTGSPATGFGLFTLSADQRSLSSYIEHDSIITNARRASIHLGAPGISGSPVFLFSSFKSPIAETWNDMTFTDVSSLLDENLYIDIHSWFIPSGEIRGQIEKKQLKYGLVLSDTLANDCAGTGTGTSGIATITLKPGSKELTVEIIHDVAFPSDGQIHLGLPCVSGPQVFPFTTFTSPIKEIWYLSDSDVINLLQGELYVDIHSASFPGGEIRGQFGDCCQGNSGDINGDGTNSNILDLTFIVDFIFRGGSGANCPTEADFNGDGTPSNILDLTFIVDFIFRGGPPTGSC